MTIDYSLYLVADAEFAEGRDLLAIIEAAVTGGVTVVQLRAKSLPLRNLLDLGTKAGEVLTKRGVPLIINDRVDIVLGCGAAGVHLGQDDMPLPVARNILGPGKIIGISVSTPDEARDAEAQGADYVAPGPIFETSTKVTGIPTLGPEKIRKIKAVVKIPVIGIGGISARNAGEVVVAGADGIAVISAILGAGDAEAAARQLRRVLDGRS